MKNTFNLLGDICQDDSQKWFESDVVPAMVIGWLAKQDGDVEININSLGGSVTGGLAIANAIKGYAKGNVTANVLGVAASMASVVACAADEIKMGKGAFMMIHNPWSYALGDSADLRKEADTLDKMKDAIIGFYQSKFSVPAMELAKLMDDETWIEDKDCELYGLAATTSTEEIPAAAHCDTRMMFAKAPEAAAAFFAAHKERPRAAEPPQPIDWESRFKGLQAAKDKEIASLTAARDKALAEKMEFSRALEETIAAQKALADRHADELAAVQAKAEDFERQLGEAKSALESAKADLSSAAARAETAERALAEKGEQLNRLEAAHALLTGGVLSPGVGMTDAEKYARDLKAAKSPEQREAIRKAHRSAAKK